MRSIGTLLLFLPMALLTPGPEWASSDQAIPKPSPPVQGKAESEVLLLREGAVGFLAVGRPSLLKIRGKGSSPKGSITVRRSGQGFLASGTFEFNLDTLDTGINKRNEHMREKYLETKAHPNAIFELATLALPPAFANDGFSSESEFEGQLTLHGVTKEVKGKAVIRRDKGLAQVSARLPIKLSDFRIAIPSFAGITVAEEVEILIKFKAGK